MSLKELTTTIILYNNTVKVHYIIHNECNPTINSLSNDLTHILAGSQTVNDFKLINWRQCLARPLPRNN